MKKQSFAQSKYDPEYISFKTEQYADNVISLHREGIITLNRCGKLIDWIYQWSSFIYRQYCFDQNHRPQA